MVTARPWSDEVMYFVMTDRFHDADPSNNRPPGSDPDLHDPAQRDIRCYFGGDLRGLENALESGYFNDLGVTALWLTPVVRNVWRSGYDLGGWKSGYHGYWTQDWLDIDPHLVSGKSLDGTPYADDADGRMAHYRDFVKRAHSKGIRIIQDVVLNHAGPVFFYDADGDRVFDVQEEKEWVRPFRREGRYEGAVWADVLEWNALRARPEGAIERLGRRIALKGTLSRLDVYTRKGFSWDSLGKRDGEEMLCDFFSLRDLDTAPDSPHFDELVDEFVQIHHFYLNEVGVDGLRIDTVKHVHRGFWDAFTERLRSRLGSAAVEKLLFGEVYDGDPAVLGRYTWREDWNVRPGPSLDAVLDFNFCFAARDYLRHSGDHYGSSAQLERALGNRKAKDFVGRPFYNPNPGPDGLNAAQKMITFIENHDGINRFRVAGITERRNLLAQALVLTMPGIPCLYYGTEAGLPDHEGRIGPDSETGRLMFYRREGGPVAREVRGTESFMGIARLAALRARLPVLRLGEFIPLWTDGGAGSEDDGVFAFARAEESARSCVIVTFNASSQPRVTGAGGLSMRLPASLKPAGRMLRPVFAIGASPSDAISPVAADGPLLLPVPASGMRVWEIVSPQS
jgi:glycosidase